MTVLPLPAALTVRAMLPTDIPEVMAIEKMAHLYPWTASGYTKELTHNQMAHYFVLIHQPAGEPPRIVGYAGYWLIADECHVSTIARHPNWKRCGAGELLMQIILRDAITRQASLATLEVRRSNLIAQALYRKYGFETVGERKAYYPENREDALLMTVTPLDDAYRQRLHALWRALVPRLTTSFGPVTV